MSASQEEGTNLYNWNGAATYVQNLWGAARSAVPVPLLTRSAVGAVSAPVFMPTQISRRLTYLLKSISLSFWPLISKTKTLVGGKNMLL